MQSVWEAKKGLKTYVISPYLCSYHTKQKFQPFLKSFSRMSQKTKPGLRVTHYILLDVIIIPRRNSKVIFQIGAVGKNGLKNCVFSAAWCSFHTTQKRQLFFKSCFRVSQRTKMDLKNYLRSFIKRRNSKHFASHFPECLRQQKLI